MAAQIMDDRPVLALRCSRAVQAVQEKEGSLRLEMENRDAVLRMREVGVREETQPKLIGVGGVLGVLA